MTTIIAGCFEQQTAAQHAVEELQQAGFARNHISVFYVNQAGQHNTHPVGGDHGKAQGAEDSGKGVAAGVAGGGTVGAVIGATTAPLTGPVGTAIGATVGAYVGSLVGSLTEMKDDGQHPEETPPLRQPGMYVAIALPDESMEEQAINALRSTGAGNIERAQGTITDGNWADFDPASSPTFVEPMPHSGATSSSSSHVRKS